MADVTCTRPCENTNIERSSSHIVTETTLKLPDASIQHRDEQICNYDDESIFDDLLTEEKPPPHKYEPPFHEDQTSFNQQPLLQQPLLQQPPIQQPPSLQQHSYQPLPTSNNSYQSLPLHMIPQQYHESQQFIQNPYAANNNFSDQYYISQQQPLHFPQHQQQYIQYHNPYDTTYNDKFDIDDEDEVPSAPIRDPFLGMDGAPCNITDGPSLTSLLSQSQCMFTDTTSYTTSASLESFHPHVMTTTYQEQAEQQQYQFYLQQQQQQYKEQQEEQNRMEKLEKQQVLSKLTAFQRQQLHLKELTLHRNGEEPIPGWEVIYEHEFDPYCVTEIESLKLSPEDYHFFKDIADREALQREQQRKQILEQGQQERQKCKHGYEEEKQQTQQQQQQQQQRPLVKTLWDSIPNKQQYTRSVQFLLPQQSIFTTRATLGNVSSFVQWLWASIPSTTPHTALPQQQASSPWVSNLYYVLYLPIASFSSLASSSTTTTTTTTAETTTSQGYMASWREWLWKSNTSSAKDNASASSSVSSSWFPLSWSTNNNNNNNHEIQSQKTPWLGYLWKQKAPTDEQPQQQQAQKSIIFSPFYRSESSSSENTKQTNQQMLINNISSYSVSTLNRVMIFNEWVYNKSLELYEYQKSLNNNTA